MNTWLPAIIMVVALALANGCGGAAKAEAKKDMENSKAACERCLRQNPGDPSKCEALRRAYEADVETYHEAGKATGPTATGFIEFGGGGSAK